MRTIHSLVHWFCSQLTEKELLEAISLLLDVFHGRCKSIRLKRQFREKHPNYRDFEVDTTPPLTEPSEPMPHDAEEDWRELLAEHRVRTGRELKAVRRRNGIRPPAGSRCEHCNAPADWLYVNDGKKCSQLRCKICDHLFPARRVRHDARGPFWCPYCGGAMYEWKHNKKRTIHKCPNDKCPHYLQARSRLNLRERTLAKTGMSSQFKLRYQWRTYHFDPAVVRPAAPRAPGRSLQNVRRNMNEVGLALAYSVSLGLSSRMTSEALRRIHGIKASHQTVLNWIEAAAPLAWNTLQRLKGGMTELGAAADETYIKIRGVWHYTWFVIGTESRAIWAWNVSEDRGAVPAVAVINQTLDCRDPDVDATLVLVGDGNPSYDTAVNAANTDAKGKPLPAERRKVERRSVVGLKNEDDESSMFRAFKQLVERVNRTYRYHTRSRFGHKSLNGANALTTLFVAHYNFLRPHRELRGRPPVPLPELDNVETLQGQWLKLLGMGA